MVPGLGVVVCLESMGVGRPVVRQSVVIDEAAQVADVKWAEQPLFFRLIEQCQRLFRLIESYFLNMFSICAAVYRLSGPSVAASGRSVRQEQSRRAAVQAHIIGVSLIIPLFGCRNNICVAESQLADGAAQSRGEEQLDVRDRQAEEPPGFLYGDSAGYEGERGA